MIKEMFLSSDKEMVELAVTLATEKNFSIEEMREMIKNNPNFFLYYDYEESSLVVVKERYSFGDLFIRDPSRLLKLTQNEIR